jgi:hypothetical protein
MDANVFLVKAWEVENGDIPIGAGVLSNGIAVYTASKFQVVHSLEESTCLGEA